MEKVKEKNKGGRPKLDSIVRKTQVTCMLTPEQIKQLDSFSDYLEMSRSTLMANLIDTGLDDLRVYKAIGALRAVKTGQYTNSRLHIRQPVKDAS